MLNTMLKALEALAVSLLAIFAPAEPMIAATSVMVIADLLTGLLVARKQDKPITSSGLKKTVLKLFVYNLVIVLAFVVDKYLTKGLIVTLNLITGIIGVTELKSVTENLNILSGGSILNLISIAISSEAKSLPGSSDPVSPAPPQPPPPAQP